MKIDEIKLKNSKFNTKYGTASTQLKPTILYIKSKARITPVELKINFEEEINEIKNKIKIYVENLIKKHKSFNDTSIINIDISSKSVTFNKVSYLKFDIYVKPKIRKSLEQQQDIMEEFSNEINQYIIELLKENNFNII